MNIVVDLDNTLFESDAIRQTMEEFKVPMKRQDVRTWDLIELPEDCRKEINKRFKLPEYMCNLKPCEGAVDKISKWSHEGYVIYCLTARYLDIEQPTIEMVKKHFPSIKETYVVNGDKTKLLIKLKPDLFVDDGPHYVIEGLNLGINTIMISNKHTPYNHHLRSTIKWYTKISDIK